jgi:S1-C subfamily serine protease
MMSLMGNSSYLGGGISEFYEKYYNEKVLKVFNVRQDSPADRAGFQAQDVMLEFDGQAFPSVTDLRLYIFQLPIGKEVPVVVKRGREKVKLTVEVGVKRHYNSEFSF